MYAHSVLIFNMIDIKLLRTNPELIRQAIINKSAKIDLDNVINLDKKKLEIQKKIELLRARRNELSTSKDGKMDTTSIQEARNLKDEISQIELIFNEIEEEFLKEFKKIPNIPTNDTPIWFSEDENQITKKWGNPTQFSFPPRNHAEISSARGWIDKERASKVAGSRFAYLKGDLVKLQIALVSWVIDALTDELIISEIIKENNLSVSTKPFIPVFPPFMIRTTVYDAMDRLEPSEDRYKIEGQDLWLQWSAEHVLWSMHTEEIFSEADMPVRYLGYATSFRWEAWTYWKDMEGIMRMHQFDKLEMESFSTPESSHEEHLFFSAIQEYLMQKLELPYQKLQKCTFDIWKPNAKGSDIETWLPWQQKYRETHTADYMTDYQSRRLKTRVRRTNGELDLVHTNDATAFACGRALVAIIENYQNEDMTIRVPLVLQPYLAWRKEI